MALDDLADAMTDRGFILALLGETGIVFTIVLLGELLINVSLSPSGDSLAYLDWFSGVAVAVFVAYRVVATAFGSTRDSC